MNTKVNLKDGRTVYRYSDSFKHHVIESIKQGRMRIDDKIMFQRLFALGKKMKGENYDSVVAKSEIKQILNMLLESEKLILSS